MSENLGVIEATGDTRSLRFVRRYRCSAQELWSALTEPERLRDWFTTAEIDARQGGSVSFDFGEHGICNGRVTACDPPRVLEYEWTFPDGPRSLVRWELAPEGDSTRVTVLHTLMPADAAAGYAAGWHAYLDSLQGHLVGATSDWQERFDELLPVYTEFAEQR